MRISAPLLTLVGTVGGTAAAIVAYQSASSVGASETEPASAPTANPAPVSTTDWLPCDPGFRLKGDNCVKLEEKVVVVRDAAPVSSARVAGSGKSGRDHAEDDDDRFEDQYDDRDDDRDEVGDDDRDDHEDESDDRDDHEDDDHEDEDREDVGDDD